MRRQFFLAIGVIAVVIACRPTQPRAIRQRSDTFMFRIMSEPSRPYAREEILYKIVVLDAESNQPIENGEGRVFAENRDRAKTYDALERGPEVATYYAKLEYVTAGEWAVAIQFRRDSLAPLERIDWTQQVFEERSAP
ncbi:MAG: hypothetical protein H7Z74_12135 [Anaerolineae bacterium]|nr:hypothetical protein [Gemmatimonadaceae bacterium]